jgi:hypothetical protein
LLANGRWFFAASSTTKTGRHDIAEILLKVALNTINQILTLCDKEDSIMADKGSNVQDLFAPCDVTINIPIFFGKEIE